MQKIIPHLWFDTQAQEAAQFYTALFPDSEVSNVITLRNTPSGDTDVVSFRLWGQEFMAISAGPLFRFNPTISFFVNFDPSRDDQAQEKLDATWSALAEGGQVMMELGEYPFSQRYGWVQDKYGLSWQLILTNPEGESRPPLVPSLLFTGERTGQAAAAVNFYVSVFKNAHQGMIAPYEQPPANAAARTAFADFKLEDTWLAAMDSGVEQDFDFNEAISFIVRCQDQAEIDYYWEKLSAVPESEQCGWLKDKFGVSWQIVPQEMDRMMAEGSQEQIDRLTQAFLPMKKLDLAKLQQAYGGDHV